MRRRLKSAALALVLAPLAGAWAAGGPLPLRWADLQPQAARGGLSGAAGEALSRDLDGREIELAGYLLPVDREDDLVYEFLLVPVAGACSHARQPPPNQVVLVRPEKPYRLSALYEPVAVAGTLRARIEKTQLFILDGTAVVTSGYGIGRARVTHAAVVPDGMPEAEATPWNFLKR